MTKTSESLGFCRAVPPRLTMNPVTCGEAEPGSICRFSHLLAHRVSQTRMKALHVVLQLSIQGAC